MSEQTKFEAEVTPIIGEEATLALMKDYGGIDLRVPATITPDHALTFTIGYENAVKLSKAFGRCVLKPPLGKKRKQINLIKEVTMLKNSGRSVDEIALYLNYTSRGVRKILKRSAA